VAIERGPLVYCIEQVDQPAVEFKDVQVDTRGSLSESWRDELLGGVVTLEAQGAVPDTTDWAAVLYRPLGSPPPAARPVPLTAIPYYAWANRASSAMRVWIPRQAT
jgi:DUF1680 family protein